MTDSNELDKKSNTVIVTGFGPFRDFTVNPSWIVVQELSKLSFDGAEVITCEIPVEYHSVKTKVPNLWEKHKPKLVVHCGVSKQASTLVVEELAHNSGYYSPDVCNKFPSDNCCQKRGNDCLKTVFDMERVCQKIKASDIGVEAKVSRDAGRYLCEFIYYSSLSINPTTAFIHVPPIDNPYSVKQLAAAIRVAILDMLSQVNSLENNLNKHQDAL